LMNKTLLKKKGVEVVQVEKVLISVITLHSHYI
jgi:hypothetical protein